MTIYDRLDDHLLFCSQFFPGGIYESAREDATAAIDYYRGNQPAREEIRSTSQALERRWYESLDQGRPDYSLYHDPYFVADLWACWIVYSRGYIRAIQKPGAFGPTTPSIAADIGDVRSIVDLGCGLGYTTAALKRSWPKATVVGTNLDGGVQMRIARAVGASGGFTVDDRPRRRAALVFASEYFEHFEEPIRHLEEILKTCRPRFLVVANAFGTVSLGHFRYYNCGVENPRADGATTSRLFNARLRRAGFEKVRTKLWNQRPTYWRRAK